MEYITKEEIANEFKTRSKRGYHYVRTDRYVAAETGKKHSTQSGTRLKRKEPNS